jgi:hypothetical protein
MAHESFEDERIAAILKKHFISIKVDREERPDVDAVYMDFVQKTTGSGGWPLSVFLTPEGKPFYGGTYFPPNDAYGRPGFETVLTAIVDSWQNRREELVESADRLTQLLQERIRADNKIHLDDTVLTETFGLLRRMYDSEYGGFGNAPKFPQPSILSFLLVYAYRTGSREAVEMVENTLEKMSAGGICDHLGGGFHRYSVDAQWRVPHFEKMLYDQALISRVYVQAWQVKKKDRYKQLAGEIFDYVLRDMTSPEGGFYSAEDADSEGREGAFYAWTPQQVDWVLNSEEQKLIKTYYGITSAGNFEDKTTILHETMPLSDAARACGLAENPASKILAEARKKLIKARSRRIRPHRDEKIIAGWNGLMISALASGGAILDEPKYIHAAQKCAAFVLEHLYKTGRLMRYFVRSQAHEYAVLEDYSCLMQGLIDLYQADYDPQWIGRAMALAGGMLELFEDSQVGGFYFTGPDVKDLIVRTRPDFDGAIPSGNSMAAAALIRLAELTGNPKWFEHAQKVLAFYQEELKTRRVSFAEMMIAVDLWLGPRSEIVMIGSMQDAQLKEMLKSLHSHFLPRTAALVCDVNTMPLLEKSSQLVKNRRMLEYKATVYLCEDFVCKQPITELTVFQSEIEHLR